MHSVIGLQEMAFVITVALVFGLLLDFLKQPAILGYIVAGVALGPSGIGYIQDVTIIQLFADFGVLMVLFWVGMNLNIESFRGAMGVSLCVAAGQIAISLLVALGLSSIFGWSLSLTLVLAFVFALSSTAVAVKMLEAGREMDTEAGRLTLGVLIAQDLAIVPMILILRGMNEGIKWHVLGFKIAAALAILSLFVFFLGRPRRLPIFVNFTSEKPELPSLVSLSFCFGFATLSGFLGLSVAYGAFLAGLLLGNLRERVVMKKVIMPIYSVLLMTFFVSVGLFINVRFIWEHVWLIGFLSVTILVLKTCVNMGLLRLLGQCWPTTFLTGVVLAQMGEFAFLIVSIAQDGQVISTFQQQMLLTLTALSLGISPLWMAMSGRLRSYQLRSQASFHQTLHIYAELLGGWSNRLFKRGQSKKDSLKK